MNQWVGRFVAKYFVALLLVKLLVIGALAYGAYWYYTQVQTRYTAYDAQVAELSSQLDAARKQNQELGGSLMAEKERNDAFENQISDITGTVGQLEKLSKTDPELLAKYSKVYFLNENFVPSGLTTIDSSFAQQEDKVLEFHREAYPFLKDMLEDARDDGVDLKVVSAFRSFGTQAGLKESYSVRYGSGANAFSADQGYSEHQLGTAVDVTVNGVGLATSFADTQEYQWLLDNAHRYGFILSYPKDNAFYIYEPWHWRFVGTNLARDLHRDGKYFYDLDQREIDEYLITLFD